MPVNAAITIGRPGQFKEFERYNLRRLEKAMLAASSRASKACTREIRAAMQAAGLGRLGNAIGSGSDLDKRGSVHRTGGGGFSASGWVHLRSRSERTLGAIEAYTEGSDIRPRASSWLAISTPQIPKRVGRHRMTPDLYRQNGFKSH